MEIRRRDGSLVCTTEGFPAGTLNSALLDDLDLSNAVLDDVKADTRSTRRTGASGARSTAS